ncbi:MAG TPA: SpoIIE family protein phosphatase [Solirubrobacteraceae bacterium]|jgi:serine phosphatase RsbU (regulator of sigma subunit)|nr:SpoIIE family protein phosphatase [Solirubrobacteraceae bacterium]
MSVRGSRRAATDGSALTVLLVEDDEGDALLVEDELREQLDGVALLRARTLAEALGTLAEAPAPTSAIDCVLLDLGLPDASGIGAVARLRRGVGGVAPLIVLTGLDDEAAGMAAVQAGAQDYLVKGSVDRQQLGRSIRYAIGRRRAEESERALLLAQAQASEVTRLERGLAPTLSLRRSSVWVESCYRAGRSRALLGGDFFDLVEGDDGCVHVVVGDVCGHGPDEAAIGVSLRVAWRALALAGARPEVALGTLQQVLEHERHLPGLFATLCTLRIEPQPTSAWMIRAGHPRPLLISQSDAVSVISEPGNGHTGIGIGNARGRWRAEPIVLPREWTLLLYTDGIIDGRVGCGAERLGEGGLARLLGEQMASLADWRERPRDLLEGLVEEAERLNGQALNDDVAMLLLGARADADAGTPR